MAADTLVVTDVTLGTPCNWKMGGGQIWNLEGLSVTIDESAVLSWSRPLRHAAASTAAVAILECTPYKYLIILFHTALSLKYRLSSVK